MRGADTSRGARRSAGLDGLRGVAAFVVVLRHTLNAIPVPQPLLQTLIESPLALLLNAQGAVQLFFVLSGFVLASSLDRPPDAAWVRRLPAFFAKRVLRIQLPYVAAVGVSWLLAFGFLASEPGPGLTPWIASSTRVQLGPGEMLATWVFPGSARGLLPQGWTLAIEMVYSLLLPMLFWVGRRSALLLLAGALMALYLSPASMRGLFYGIDFAIGIALYCHRERIGAWLQRTGRGPLAAIGLLGLFLFASPMLLGWSVWSEAQGFFVSGFRRNEVLLMGIGSGVLVALAHAVPGWRDALSWRPFAFLGRISFSLYLLHRVFIALLAPRIDTGSRGLDVAILYAGVIVLSIVSSVLFERWIDQPAIRAGRAASRWIRGAPPIAPAPRA